MLDEQRVALTAVRGLSEPAPAGLRTRVEGARRRPAPAVRTRRFGIAGGLRGGGRGARDSPGRDPPLGRRWAQPLGGGGLHPRGAGESAPAARLRRRPRAHCGRGALPYWEDGLGWNAVGTRVDKVGGRTATTVFYAKGDKRVGYTIVSGKGLSVPSSSVSTLRNQVTSAA